MLLDISCHSYENIKTENENNEDTSINYNNINRIVRIREIFKKRQYAEKDNLDINEIKKFQEAKYDMDLKVQSGLMHTKVKPKFLKGNFRMKTVQKYNVCNGVYFGSNK